MKTRVLMVDDHPLFRSGLAVWLAQQPDLICCGEADSIASAREAIARFEPEVVLLDLRLGDGDGLDLAREVRETHPSVRIVALSQNDELFYAHRALQAGVRGYVMKSEATEVLHTAITTVARGEIYVSRPVAARLLHNLFPDPTAPMRDLAHLSDRELQVFQLLGAGLATRQIAERLKISPKTVDTYREHLKDKLQLADGRALVAAATRWVEEGRMDIGADNLRGSLDGISRP